ncbi:MAG TPA: response regulator [Cytophagales bacterium]|nr:response regulator [Cytophagales bacterium]
MAMNSVLIIDDDEVDFIIHSKIIHKENSSVKVTYKSSGIEALNYLNKIIEDGEEWPTHILVDINMPPINGFEFVEAYSKYPEKVTQKAKIYILSSSDSSDDKSKAREYPLITDYIVKPLSIEIARKIFSQS